MSVRRTYTELELPWKGPSKTMRISKFEPSAARLYFIFRSHFLMPLIQKKLWFLCWKGVWVNGIPPSKGPIKIAI